MRISRLSFSKLLPLILIKIGPSCRNGLKPIGSSRDPKAWHEMSSLYLDRQFGSRSSLSAELKPMHCVDVRVKVVVKFFLIRLPHRRITLPFAIDRALLQKRLKLIPRVYSVILVPQWAIVVSLLRLPSNSRPLLPAANPTIT